MKTDGCDKNVQKNRPKAPIHFNEDYLHFDSTFCALKTLSLKKDNLSSLLVISDRGSEVLFGYTNCKQI